MDYYDQLETQDSAARAARLAAALPGQIANAQQNSPAFATILAGVDPASVTSREALAQLPVTRKSDLQERQKQHPPFGGLVATPLGRLARVFQSPGPIYDPDARRPDYWRFARAMFAAGIRAGELVHNTFAYTFTPAGFMAETGAHALGCPVFPAGVGQTELQVRAIADLKPQAYIGTPSFLKIILDKAEEMGADVSSLTKALVAAEALPPSLREEFRRRGVNVLQCLATADLGLVAYESLAMEGMIVDEGVLVEIVRPGTGEPVPDGEVGELVVTAFNPDYPLIRFGTGDLSAIMPGVSPCGRTNTRIRGWLGRADQTTKVKGMFVRPSQVAEILKRHPEVLRGRVVVDQHEYQDVMTLHCEVAGEGGKELADAIVKTVREVCKLRGGVKFLPPGSLPNDGKVIDDIRKYE